MFVLEVLEEKISEYYDNEMNELERLNFEARIANFKGIMEFTDNTCDEYYQISRSIRKSKIRNSFLVNEITYELENKSLIFDIYSMARKFFKESFGSFVLNIFRNNSK